MDMPQPDRTPLAQIIDWRGELKTVHTRIAPRFARPEVRAGADRDLAGLLAPVARRNGWHLAEQIGEHTPDGVQRLLRTARFDAEAVRAYLDRALYLPNAWAADQDRRRDAGVPPEVTFVTKPALTRTMLARAFAAEVPAG